MGLVWYYKYVFPKFLKANDIQNISAKSVKSDFGCTVETSKIS